MAIWIPVREQKPIAVFGDGESKVVSNDVLCYFDGAPIAVCCYDHDADEWCDSFTLDAVDCEPTHWMPLPEPPK